MSTEERAEWADEALNRINNILADPTLSDDVRQQTEESFSAVKLMLAGMALSTWTPRGMWRKVVFFGLIGAGIAVVLGGNLWGLFLVLLSALFSPRLMGETMALIGLLARYWVVVLIVIGIIYWLLKN
jgi:hypothetical protein